MAVFLRKSCILLCILLQGAGIALSGRTFQKWGEHSQKSEWCSEEIHGGRPHGGRFRPMPPGDWKACGDGTAGNPLYLTPFLKNGSIEKAVELSRVLGVGANASYSGYLTVDERFDSNMFFWFFPAQENPADAPVVLWLQGGPGASSLFGLFVEIGPLAATKDGEITEMAVTWNKKYSLLFIDNPVGTGFSFTSKGGYARDEADVAANLYSGLTQFFSIYTAYAKNDFYATGESYAGKYVPAISQRIIAGNGGGGDAPHINFKGMAIGDGWTDPLTQYPAYPDLLQQMSVIDAAQAAEARETVAAIVAAIRERRFADAFRLDDAFLLGTLTPYPTWLTNVSGSTDHYSVLRSSLPPAEAYYGPALVKDAVRRAIHVGDVPYDSGRAVEESLLEDISNTSLPAFLSVLGADGGRYKVMVYNGQFDIVVGVPLTEAMLADMDWPGKGEFHAAERVVWRLRAGDPEVAGYARTVRNLQQVVVRGAGHMVPLDQPERALDLITRFIEGVPFS